MLKTITREYNYSDVYLIPNKCVVNSRSECDPSVVFGGRKFAIPVCPANMPAVVNEDTCVYLAKKDIFYTYHRFYHNQIDFIYSMISKGLYTSISIGVNEESINQVREIKRLGLSPDYITIDIAHSHSPKAERMIKLVKDLLPESFLIVGNMATGEAVQDIEKWGADCCRVFIGPGGACTTRVMTGFTRPTISCLIECVEAATKPIIADGGVKENGDILKAISVGADMVMAGSLFCGFDQSGSEVIDLDGHKKCMYYGNASEHAKNGHHKHVEGKKVIIDYKGNMDDFLVELTESIQSGISYAGGRDLSALLTAKMVAIN